MTKRRAIQVVVFLLLGAIVNVAVAWGMAAYAPFWPFERDWKSNYSQAWREDIVDWWKQNHPFIEPTLPIEPPPDPPADLTNQDGLVSVHARLRDYTATISLSGMEIVFASGTQSRTRQAGAYGVMRVRCGYPAKSTGAVQWRDSVENKRQIIRRGGYPIAPHAFTPEQGELTFLLGDRLLPCSPLWPGFAINTIFYAAVLWMVFALPFVVRRRRRIKRGLCPACAYPVGASPVCTECGKPVTPKSVEQS